MIRIITTSTSRYYEAKVEEAGKVPGLEHQLAQAQETTTMWEEQAADYQRQLRTERERTYEISAELRQLRAGLDDAAAIGWEEGKPLLDLFHEILQRLQNPSDAPTFRKELALLCVERWVALMTPEEHKSPMGVILRVITDSPIPTQDGEGEEHQEHDEAESEAPASPAPAPDPKLVEQMLAAATLRGPDPFPSIG